MNHKPTPLASKRSAGAAAAATQAPRYLHRRCTGGRCAQRSVGGRLLVRRHHRRAPSKIVSIIDEHTRECLGGLVERSITPGPDRQTALSPYSEGASRLAFKGRPTAIVRRREATLDARGRRPWAARASSSRPQRNRAPAGPEQPREASKERTDKSQQGGVPVRCCCWRFCRRSTRCVPASQMAENDSMGSPRDTLWRPDPEIGQV